MNAPAQTQAEWRDGHARQARAVRRTRSREIVGALDPLLAGLALAFGFQSSAELLAALADERGETDAPDLPYAVLLLVDVAELFQCSVAQVGKIIDLALRDENGRHYTRQGIRVFGSLETMAEPEPNRWPPAPGSPPIMHPADAEEWTDAMAGELAELRDAWPGSPRELEQAASQWIETIRGLAESTTARLRDAELAAMAAREQALEREQAMHAELASVRAELAESRRVQADTIAAAVVRGIRAETR